MRSETVILPAFLASALINGDFSGLEPDDMRWYDAALEYVAPGAIVSCEGEAYFSSCGGELPGFLMGADVLKYVVLYTNEPSIPTEHDSDYNEGEE